MLALKNETSNLKVVLDTVSFTQNRSVNKNIMHTFLSQSPLCFQLNLIFKVIINLK